MTHSRWLSLSAWAAITAPVAFSEIVTAFTVPRVDQCPSIAVTNHKRNSRSRSNQQRHTSSVPALLNSLFDNDQVGDHQSGLQTRNKLLCSGIDAILKVAAVTTAVAASAGGHSAAAQTAREPEITSKCFVEVKAFSFSTCTCFCFLFFHATS